MVKQSGTSFNTNVGAKKGIRTRYRCEICGRIYKQDWTKDIHQRKCKIQNKKNK